MKQNKNISSIGLMNNKELKESIEEIFTDHYFAATQSRNDKRREKIKTYINKVREEAIREFVERLRTYKVSGGGNFADTYGDQDECDEWYINYDRYILDCFEEYLKSIKEESK